jgi:Hint module
VHENSIVAKRPTSNQTMMTTTTSPVIEISAEHLLFVQNDRNQDTTSTSLHPIRAKDVQIGDILSGAYLVVQSIEYVKRRGVYAPLTQSGDMLMGGIHTSNYVGVFNKTSWSSRVLILNQHVWGHFLFTPQRLFCSYFIESCQKESYIHGYGYIAFFVVGLSDVINYFEGIVNTIMLFPSSVVVHSYSVLIFMMMIGSSFMLMRRMCMVPRQRCSD